MIIKHMNTIITFSKVNFLLRGYIETITKTELRRSHYVSQSSLRFKGSVSAS